MILDIKKNDEGYLKASENMKIRLDHVNHTTNLKVQSGKWRKPTRQRIYLGHCQAGFFRNVYMYI